MVLRLMFSHHCCNLNFFLLLLQITFLIFKRMAEENGDGFGRSWSLLMSAYVDASKELPVRDAMPILKEICWDFSG